MNILALTSVYPQPDDNGAVITPTVKYFCDKWSEAGHRVIVIHSSSSFPAVFYAVPESIRKKMESKMGHTFPTEASRKSLAYKKDGVSVYRFPMVKVIPHGTFGKGKIDKQIHRIKMVLEKEQFTPDVIISHWVNPQIDLVERLEKMYEAKISLVFHGDCSEENVKRFDLLNRVKKLDAVGCRNDSYADQVMKTLKLDKKPFICYSGIPDENAEEQMKKLEKIKLETALEFIYVGRLVKYKNVDVIIKALYEKYGNLKYKLHIIGTGAEREELERLSRELGCEDKVIFHGQLPRSDVFDMMKKCYCFIMVSNNETFGMVYIEAMLAGCVTIASKNGGGDGVIVDGENGFLSNQGDVEDLVKTLNRIEQMKELSKLREQAIRTAYGYRDSRIAQKYLDNVFTWEKC